MTAHHHRIAKRSLTCVLFRKGQKRYLAARQKKKSPTKQVLRVSRYGDEKRREREMNFAQHPEQSAKT